jgi:hypothetical protein
MRSLPILLALSAAVLLLGVSIGRGELNDSPSDAEADAKAERLPDDYFSFQAECIAAWTKLVNEWRTSGGGVKRSIAATRAQIESDNVSRFSRIVKRAWKTQRLLGLAKSEPIGAWPISNEALLAGSSGSWELGVRS